MPIKGDEIVQGFSVFKLPLPTVLLDPHVRDVTKPDFPFQESISTEHSLLGNPGEIAGGKYVKQSFKRDFVPDFFPWVF
jgi:hypothetical protein